jgi:hypothetical protein
MYARYKSLCKALIATPFEVLFRQFRLGVGLFFCGLVTIYGASQLMAPSLQQELVVLLGLVVGGIGFIIAMSAQLRMTISRIWHFFNDKKG